MQKKINEADESRKKLIDGFVNMFGIDKGGSPWITKQSVYNQLSVRTATTPEYNTINPIITATISAE